MGSSPDSSYFWTSWLSYCRSVNINLGIISGSMTCLPIFYQKSSLIKFGLSTLTSLRSKILKRSKRSDSGNSFKTPSASSGGFHEIPHKKESNTDLNDILIHSSSGNLGYNLHTDCIDDQHTFSKPAGIIKTNEYIVSSEKADRRPGEV